MFVTDQMVWRCFSQVRDVTANDNMTAWDQVQCAVAMERWAASRGQEPAFAHMRNGAVEMAETMRSAARRRMCGGR